MLVMKNLRILLCAALTVACAGPVAADPDSLQGDPGAGPVRMQVTDCLIANRTHEGTPCPEPQVPQGGDKPALIEGHLARAWYFIGMQDLQLARAEADSALAIDPNNLKARHLSARLSFTLGDLTRAEADLELARKQAPDDPDVHATYAMFLQSRATDIVSLREFDAIIRTHPSHLYSRKQASILLMRLGEYEVALANLNFVIERQPSVDLLERRAEAFMGLGRFQSAVADLSEAIKHRPNNFTLIVARADAYARADLNEFALRDYDAVLASDHGAPLYLMTAEQRAEVLQKRAFSHARLHRFDDAADDIISSISIGGTSAILRTQVLLRRHGFTDVPLDGHDSPALRKALTACFGNNVCFQGIMRSI